MLRHPLLPIGSSAHAPSRMIDLPSLELLVDLQDEQLGLTLRPRTDALERLAGETRVWHLRAPTEEAQMLWAEAIVRATRLG